VFGPEGCGKSAWLRQSAEILKERGYDVVHVDLTYRSYLPYTDVESVASARYTPPPERDADLGIGKHVTWQIPIHRDAVKIT
jgi:predicted GTPase